MSLANFTHLFTCSTFVCPTEIIAFSDRADEFRKINCELIACSTDSHFCHLAWVNTPRKQGGLGSLNIPLLADKSAAISKSYGVYKEDEGLTFRGLFIIDEQQRLRQVTINDLPVGRSVDETLRLVQAFQFTDKHGEGNEKNCHEVQLSTVYLFGFLYFVTVCPAGWTPGKKSMKADPAGSKEYFEASNWKDSVPFTWLRIFRNFIYFVFFPSATLAYCSV